MLGSCLATEWAVLATHKILAGHWCGKGHSTGDTAVGKLINFGSSAGHSQGSTSRARLWGNCQFCSRGWALLCRSSQH